MMSSDSGAAAEPLLWEIIRPVSEMSEEPSTSMASSVPKFSTLSRDSVTSWTSWRVITALPLCFSGVKTGLKPVPAPVNVIGSAGVPDLVMITDWGSFRAGRARDVDRLPRVDHVRGRLDGAERVSLRPRPAVAARPVELDVQGRPRRRGRRRGRNRREPLSSPRGRPRHRPPARPASPPTRLPELPPQPRSPRQENARPVTPIQKSRYKRTIPTSQAIARQDRTGPNRGSAEEGEELTAPAHVRGEPPQAER